MRLATKNTVTAKTAYTAVFTAFGVLLPFVTAHVFSVDAGKMFLPMHIPILLCGLVCGMYYGAACGLLSPCLSFLLTGMPLSSMLPIMIAELIVYGALGGLLYKKLKLPLYVALPAAMLAGRCAYGLMFVTLHALNRSLKAPTVFAAVITGLPGIVLQLIAVPLLINFFDPKAVRQAFIFRSRAVKLAKKRIADGAATLIVLRRGKVVQEDARSGIAGALQFYENKALSGAVIVDKIVGKAAAAVFAAGGVKAVYALTLSRSAKALLAEQGIAAAYGELADVIKDRTGQGVCPIEQSVLNISQPAEAVEAVKQRLAQLRKC